MTEQSSYTIGTAGAGGSIKLYFNDTLTEQEISDKIELANRLYFKHVTSKKIQSESRRNY